MKTHKENVLEKLKLPKDTSLNVAKLAELTGIPYEALQEVYNRGTGAWKSNIASVRLKKDYSKNPDISRFGREARLGKQEWSMARVYSFIDKGKTWHTADSDIVKKYFLK